MRKYIAFIYILFIFIIVSCTQNNKKPCVFKFEELGKIELILEKSDRNIICHDVVEFDNSIILIVNANYKKLSFYDIKTGKKIREIKTNQERILQTFKYVNKDSIFIYYHSKPWGYDFTHPEQFQLIDFDGNIKKVYHYNVDTTEIKNRKLDINDILPPSQYSNLCNILAEHNNVFFSTYRRNKGEIGTKEFMENKMPLLMHYNTEKEQFYVSIYENFPYIEIGVFYPSDFNIINYTISEKGFPLIRFFYSSVLFEWDYKNDILLKHPFKSRLFDTIMPLKVATSSSNNIEANYIGNDYDCYRKLYFSSISFNGDIFGKQFNRNKFLYSILVANKDFEYIGEVFCPIYSPDFFTKDYMLDFNRKNDSIIELTYLNLVETGIDYNKYMDSIREDLQKRKTNYFDFLEKFQNKGNFVVNFLKDHIKDIPKDYTAVTIYAQNGCIGCRADILSLIAQNQKLFEESGLYLIVTKNDSEVCIKELDDYNLLNYKNLVIDSLGTIRKLTTIDEMRNPRLTIVKNNNVVLDSIYSTFDIENVYVPTMLKSVGLKNTNN